MPDSTGNSIYKHSLVLGLFCLGVGLVLVLVNLATAGRIQEQQMAAERRALADIFPTDHHDNDLLAASIAFNPGQPNPFNLIDGLTLRTPRDGYIARNNGEFAGAIIPVDALDGYSGRIAILVGILADGTISGVRVLEHRETPGLGDKIDITVSDWILDFNGKSLNSSPAPRWQVIKDGGDFDQLVGATVTPRAVVDAVRRALQFFQINRMQLDNLDEI